MLIATVQHGQNGYSLHVSEVPTWAVVAGEVADTLCARLGHPLCRGAWPIGHRFGLWLLSSADRHSNTVWSQPLTDDEVRAGFPRSAMDLDE